MNLTENARKYTPEPGAVVVSTEKLPGKVRFTLTDTGIGIPAEDLPHIFERFYRVDKSRSTAGGGTGIGLAVARSLVRRMGGTSRRPARPGKEHACHPRCRRPDPPQVSTPLARSVEKAGLRPEGAP